MMKGLDAAVWNACEALKLDLIALPVYSPDCDDSDSDSENDMQDGKDKPSR
jgi:hypothetical protein